MFAPTVTAELAERSLIGASVHAFAVRAYFAHDEKDAAELEHARQIAPPSELAESTTAYAVSLVWWARADLTGRRDLLTKVTSMMPLKSDDGTDARAIKVGYRIYAERLAASALSPRVHARELDLAGIVSGVDQIDLMTARFADTAVHAVLLADRNRFGDPKTSAERMRDEMIQLAYLPQAA